MASEIENKASSLKITLKIVSSPEIPKKKGSGVAITFEIDSSLKITIKHRLALK